ncbi:MAG: hypothetical protein R6U96_07705 [Promethearchaeia archaeon]
MLEGNLSKEENKEIQVVCPQCQASKVINLPTQLVKETSHLVTVSIPRSFICEHGFQAFVDKNFRIRGYQKNDFEIDNMEIYETDKKELNFVIDYKLSLIIKKIIENLEQAITLSEILGGALTTKSRKVLYLSLPHEIFGDVKKQLEFQREDLNGNITKNLFELDDGRKIFIDTLRINSSILFVSVLFSSKITIPQGNKFFEKIIDYLNSNNFDETADSAKFCRNQ